MGQRLRSRCVRGRACACGQCVGIARLTSRPNASPCCQTATLVPSPEPHGTGSNRLVGVGRLSADAMQDLGLALRMEDFVAAVGKVQPSATREGFGVVPNVTWADVGALEEVMCLCLHGA